MVVSLDPASGEVYWQEPVKVDWDMNIAVPVHSGSRLLVSSFYNGSVMLSLDDDRPGAELLWKGKSDNEVSTDGLHAVYTTPVIVGDHVYGVGSFGQFRALNAATGERLWATQELIVERARWASAFIVAHDDHFFINNDRGELIIAKFSPEGYEEISRTPLIKPTSHSSNRRRLDAVNWVPAAYANQHVYIRNDEEVISASLAARDYQFAPTSTGGRLTSVSRPAGSETVDSGLPPLTIQFVPGTTRGFGADEFRPRTESQMAEFYLVSGRGTNIPLFVVDESVVVIDPGASGFQAVRDQADWITDKPVSMIINTHAHLDHSSSTVEFPNVVDVVAHENTQADMAAMELFTGENTKFLPSITYADQLSLFEGISQIDLYYFGAGHTNGDTVVVFPRFGLAFLGDLFPSKGAPAD